MPIYSVYTKIASNVPVENLLYDLAIYRMDSTKRRTYLFPPVVKQPFQSNYETQHYQTSDTNDPLNTNYMVEIMIYRKHFNNVFPALTKPFVRMYTLDDLISGKACSEKKRENACYFETAGSTKPASEGGNTIILTITVPERPFIAKEYPIGNPKDPFEKSKFEFEMVTRLDHFDFPSQNWTSLCGPAALFYCLLRDRPDVYEQAARELWQYGRTKIGMLGISPSDGCKHPSGRFYKIDETTGQETITPTVSGLDWITLASLRDSENAILSYAEVDSPVSGITNWGTLTDWFEKTGYQKIFSNISFSHSNLQDIVTLNNYINQGYTVVSLISAGMLTRAGGDTSWKNHWIVWEGMLEDLEGKNITLDSDLSSIVKLNLFSWGEVSEQLNKNLSLKSFLGYTFGALVFKKIA